MPAFISAIVSAVERALKRLFGSGPAPVPPVASTPPVPPSSVPSVPPVVAPPPPVAEPPATDRFSLCLPFTLKEEGGFVDNPDDPGGATFEGITLRTFQRYVAPSATAADLKRATPAVIASIYRQEYWATAKCDQLPAGVDLSVFDMAVNAGPAQSIKLLQRAVGAVQDGIAGPQTLSKVNAFDAATLIRRLYIEQGQFYNALPGAAEFGRGWAARNYARLNAALGFLPSAGAPKVA